MKIQVSPLVLAAALGLLGPAALEDEDQDRISGLWKRSKPDHKPSESVVGGSTPPQLGERGELGERIEVITVEDRVLFDDGSGQLTSDHGTWTAVRPDVLVQHIDVHGGRIVREFSADGDTLLVEVRVERDGVTEERWTQAYERITTLG